MKEPYQVSYNHEHEMFILTDMASKEQRSLPTSADDWELQRDLRDSCAEPLRHAGFIGSWVQGLIVVKVYGCLPMLSAILLLCVEQTLDTPGRLEALWAVLRGIAGQESQVYLDVESIWS